MPRFVVNLADDERPKEISEAVKRWWDFSNSDQLEQIGHQTSPTVFMLFVIDNFSRGFNVNRKLWQTSFQQFQQIWDNCDFCYSLTIDCQFINFTISLHPVYVYQIKLQLKKKAIIWR